MKRFIAGVISVLLVFIGVRSCMHYRDTSNQMSTELKDGETNKTILDFKSGTIVQVGGPSAVRKRQGNVHSVPNFNGARKAVVTVKKDPLTQQPEVQVWAQTSGFIVEPGIVGGLREGRSVAGVDSLFYFNHKLALSAGLVTDAKWRMSVYAGFNYQVYRNTSAFVAFDNKKSVVVGIRVGL
jgi:hypothetical protein